MSSLPNPVYFPLAGPADDGFWENDELEVLCIFSRV